MWKYRNKEKNLYITKTEEYIIVNNMKIYNDGTFERINQEADIIENQISIFDILKQ